MIWLYSKSERVFSLRTEARSLFTMSNVPHSCSMDQGGFRSLHHIVGHEVKWCFFDFNPTLIGFIVWHPLPLWILMGFWNYFGRQIIANPKNLTIELEYNESIVLFSLRRENSHWTLLHLFVWQSVTLTLFSWMNVHVAEFSYLVNISKHFILMWNCIETNID